MFESLTREVAERCVVRELARSGRFKARVRVIEVDGRRAVLKDVRDRMPVFRFTMGRLLLAREFRIYRRLEGIDGVPRAHRMLDPDGLLIEYVDGLPVTRRSVRAGALVPSAEFCDACARLVAQLHARGVVHLDLRNRRNFLFDARNRPYVVDFASALRVPAWAPFRHALMSLLGVFDRAGVLKMKRRLSPGLLSPGEKRAIRRFEIIRAVLFPPHLVRLFARRLSRRRRKLRRSGSPDARAGR